MDNNQEAHVCAYCGQEAHYQFKNGKWCCSSNMNGCPEIKRQRSLSSKDAHEKFKKEFGNALFKKNINLPKNNKTTYQFSGEHVCVHCGQYAEFQLKNGNWCCQPTANKCPEVRKRFANKRNDDGRPKRDYKKWRNSLPKEVQEKMTASLHTKEAHAKAGKTYRKRVQTGEIVPSWRGRKHTQEEIDKIRIGTVEFNTKNGIWGGARVSAKGCEYIDKLNESKGWHLQHGKNGGEITVGGYYLDGYDKDLNIAFEYDEPGHYKDIDNNVLKDRDIQRMKYIHEKLNCRFFRYNEKKDLLYEVDFSMI